MLFTFQSPYLFSIGRPGVLSLGGWAPRLHTEFHDIRATLGLLSTEIADRRVRDCHPVSSAFPDRSASRNFVTPRGPATPARRRVWADPSSLAATNGVSVDFLSARYLDVSVPWVSSGRPMHSTCRDAIFLRSDAGFPHSEIPGSRLVCQLPGAYRRLPRPSSPLDA